MCVFCELYGDGGIWYLNPRNYGRRLYNRREPGKGVSAFGRDYRKAGAHAIDRRGMVAAANEGDWGKVEELRDRYWGYLGEQRPSQVLPLRDAIKVAKLSHPIAKMACECRLWARGLIEDSESLYSCTGLGAGMLKWERWPERYKGGLKFMSPDETAEWLTKWDKRGMVHLIMTYGAPYIGGICNCDYPDCGAIRTRLELGIYLLKSHYIAEVDYNKCNGCGICAQRCQFGAVKMEVTTRKANIDMFNCFGCGLCETGCPRGAITLAERVSIPALKEVW